MTKKVTEPTTEPAPAGALTQLNEIQARLAEPAAGVLSSLLDFVLPDATHRHAAGMGRNGRHDLLAVVQHLTEAKVMLRNIAEDCKASNQVDAHNALSDIIERLS
jgi:hypothetical protein